MQYFWRECFSGIANILWANAKAFKYIFPPISYFFHQQCPFRGSGQVLKFKLLFTENLLREVVMFDSWMNHSNYIIKVLECLCVSNWPHRVSCDFRWFQVFLSDFLSDFVSVLLAEASRRKSDTSNLARKVIMITLCIIYPQVVYLLTFDFGPVVHRPHPHQYKFMTQTLRNTSLMMKICIFLELLFYIQSMWFLFQWLKRVSACHKNPLSQSNKNEFT